MSPKENIIEQLLSERESTKVLDKAIARARELGVPEQAILESKFLFHVDRAEDEEIAKMLPLILKQREHFELADSEIFGSKDDWLAVVEYVQAISALQEGDKKKFKHHITEAFWLSPRQGAAFAPHIDRLRLDDAMKEVQLDMDQAYLHTLDDGSTKLGELLSEKRGMLLHFWSPWSQECEATLADFFLTAQHLTVQNIAVASVLPQTSDKVIADAKAMLVATKKKIPGYWLVDTDKSQLSTQLRIQTVPTVVLVDPNGKIVFNGHPTNEEFWKQLGQLNPAIVRPKMKEE